MRLFNKDVDLIKRILNLILILWFIGAIFIFYTNLVDVILKEPAMEYSEFKAEGCHVNIYIPKSEFDAKTEATKNDEYCKAKFEVYKFDKNNNYDETKNLIIAIGNAFIVGGFLFIINKKR